MTELTSASSADDSVAAVAVAEGESPNLDPGDGRTDLVKVAFWTMLAQISLPLTSLISGPILARTLGPEGRGVYAAVLSPVLVLAFLAAVGLPDATTYAVARLKIQRAHVVVLMTRVTLLYSIVAAALLIVFAPQLLEKTPQAVTLMRWTALTIPLQMCLTILRQVTSGSRDFKWRNIERVVMSVSRLLFLVFFAILGWLTATSAVWVTTITSLVGVPILLIAMFGWRFPRALHEDPETARTQPHLTRQLSRYGLRGWGGTLAYLVNWRLDQAVMVVLVSATQLGYYAVAVSLAELPQTAFLQMKNVLFAESAARDSTELIARAARILIGVTAVLSVLGMVASPILVPLMFGRRFEPAVLMAQILLAGTIPFLLDSVVAAGLLSLGMPGRRSIGQIAGGVVTVTGLFVLCPRIGAVGAAWTSLAAYTCTASISTVLFARTTGIPVRRVLFMSRGDARWITGRVTKMFGKKLRPAGR